MIGWQKNCEKELAFRLTAYDTLYGPGINGREKGKEETFDSHAMHQEVRLWFKLNLR